MAQFFYEFPSVGSGFAPARSLALKRAGHYATVADDGTFPAAAAVAGSYYSPTMRAWCLDRPINYWMYFPLHTTSSADGTYEIHLVIKRTGFGDSYTDTGGGLYFGGNLPLTTHYAVTTGAKDSWLTVYKQTSGTGAYPYMTLFSDGTYGNKRHCRVRVVPGTPGTLYLKQWKDGTPEPPSWNAILSYDLWHGSMGLYLNGLNALDCVYSFAVGTNGDPAPTLASAPKTYVWGFSPPVAPGDALFLADNLSLSPIAPITLDSNGAWIKSVVGYLPPAHLQIKHAAGGATTLPVDAYGRGGLSGTYPVGGVTDNGTPVSGAEIEVVLRRPGLAGDGAIVQKTTTDPSGSWGIVGANPSSMYDVIARMAGRNDAIASRITPVPLSTLLAPSEFVLSTDRTVLLGAAQAVGGVGPYTITKTAGSMPYGVSMVVDPSTGLAAPDNPLIRQAGDFTASYEMGDSTGKKATFVVGITDALRSQRIDRVGGWWAGHNNLGTVSITLSSLVQTGDLILIHGIHRQSTADPTITTSESGQTLTKVHPAINAYASSASGYHWLCCYAFTATASTLGSTITFTGNQYTFMSVSVLRGLDATPVVKGYTAGQRTETTTSAQYLVPEVTTRGGLVIAFMAHPYALAGPSSKSGWVNATPIAPTVGLTDFTLRGGGAWYWQTKNAVQAATYSPGAKLDPGYFAHSIVYVDESRPDLPGW